MKYFAVIRTYYTGGEWISGTGTHVYKSEQMVSKDEAKKWIEENANKILQKEGEDYQIMHKTIIALDENESENYEEFFKFTFE